MTKILTIVGLLMIAGGLGFHFGAVDMFNALVPKDAESKRLVRNVAYGTDPRQKLDVYAPKEGQGPWPVVVFVHGGSWQSGNKNPYAFAGRAIAAQGFVTMVMNYRLHPKHQYPAFVEDVGLALQWASENAATYGGDGKQLFAFGHSAGAYNIAQVVLNPRFQTKVPPLKGVVGLAGPYDFLPLDTRVTKAVFGGLSDQAESQPVNHASANAPPFLLLHGTEDTTVFPKNARNLDAALRKAGAQSELRFYEGISHVGILLALSKLRRKTAPVLADAVAFMKDKSR